MSLSGKKPLLAVAGLVGLAFFAWLAFGFFGIQAAVLDNEVDEAGPVFAESSELEDGSEDEALAATEEPEPTTTVAAEVADADTADADTADADTAEADTADADTAEADTAEGEIATVASGDFAGLSRYNVEGQAVVLNDGSEQRFLRFENFSADNGPDLKVYLRADNGDFVNLGELKGNIGDQNYEIPPDVDLSVFNTVDIWCERFSVGFGVASLA